MKYCPVMVKIENYIQERFYKKSGHCYLLQVWDSENEKIFELSLFKPVRAWAIFYNYFIFKPEEGDENCDYIHLRDLERNSTVLIDDFTHDPSCKYINHSSTIVCV